MRHGQRADGVGEGWAELEQATSVEQTMLVKAGQSWNRRQVILIPLRLRPCPLMLHAAARYTLKWFWQPTSQRSALYPAMVVAANFTIASAEREIGYLCVSISVSVPMSVPVSVSVCESLQ